MSAPLTLLSKKLYTLNPDGTELKELLYPSEWTQNRIGEYKKVVMEFSSTQDIADNIIYFNPALYLVPGVTPFTTGAIPTEGYSYIVDSASTMGTFDMTPFVNTPYNTDLAKNWEVKITIGYGDNFTITMKYYQDEDRSGFLSTISQYNHDKLLKDKIGSTSELSVSGTSVYTDVKAVPNFYICQVNIANPVLKVFRTIEYDLYKGGFYNKNEHETAPYFTNPIWQLSDSSGVKSTFGLLEDTTVEFFVDSATPITKFFAWLIRTDTNDNSVDFKTNYEASFAYIYDNVGSTVLDNKITAPSLAMALDSGTTWKGQFTIDKDLLTLGAKYRMISIIYDEEGGYVNSFISDEILTDLPAFNGDGYTFVAKLRDYFNDWYGNDLACVVEERLQSIININYDYFGFSDDILHRLGLTVSNDIRRYLTKVTVEIYEDASSQLRHYLQRSIAYKTSPTTYVTPDGMELNFTTGNLEIKYPWRNRYESWIPNIESTFNGVIITPSSNQNWATRTIKIRTRLELFYDDYSTPFTDELVFMQSIRPKTYETQGLRIFEVVDGVQQSISSTGYYCPEDTNCFRAILTSGSEDFKLLTTIEKSPGTITTIEENEEMLGILAQSDTNKFTDQDLYFGEAGTLKADWCIDGTKFVYDNFYKMCAIAKKQNK